MIIVNMRCLCVTHCARQMGSGKAFAATDLPEAVRALSRLEECATPLEKLLGLKVRKQRTCYACMWHPLLMRPLVLTRAFVGND